MDTKLSSVISEWRGKLEVATESALDSPKRIDREIHHHARQLIGRFIADLESLAAPSQEEK